jgi:TolB-like protein
MAHDLVLSRLARIAAASLLLVLPACHSAGFDYRTPNTNLSGLKVVVLPFSNLTTTPDAGKSVTALFVSEVNVRHPFILIDFPDPDLLSGKVDPATGSVPVGLRRRIKASTGADAVLSGTVTEFEYRVGGTSRPVVGMSWTLVSMGTGRVLWAASVSRMGSCFWTCRDTVSGLARNLIDEKIVSLGKR